MFGKLRHARRLAASLAGLSHAPLLGAGLHLGLFEALRRPRSAEELAERLGLEPELVAAWARALYAEGWLARHEQGYQIHPTLEWLLDAPESPALQALIDYGVETLVPRLARLPQLMKSSERAPEVSDEEAHRIALISRLAEARALRALHAVPGARRAKQVLDVGCGQGSYLIAFLQRYRDAQGVGVELDPGVAEEARRALREAGVERRGEIVVGDFRTLELPTRRFDLILLNHNLYYFPPAEHPMLFRRVREHLESAGTVAIQTPVLSEGRVADFLGFSSATALLDLLLRLHGNLYGLPDLPALHRVLSEAGFSRTGEVPVFPGGAIRYVWASQSG